MFAGIFELDAAQHVCGADMAEDEFLDLLTSLVDKSILIRTESNNVVRFRLLETLREYGRQQIQQDAEYDELRRRHADWYRRLARDAFDGWFSPRQLDWLARIQREMPNIREALEFSLSEDGGGSARDCRCVTTVLDVPGNVARVTSLDGPRVGACAAGADPRSRAGPLQLRADHAAAAATCRRARLGQRRREPSLKRRMIRSRTPG